MNGLVFNEDVYVEKSRAIAARGLTPNHVHARAKIEARGIAGRLERFRHDQQAGTTTISILTFPYGQRVEITLGFLDEILVES